MDTTGFCPRALTPHYCCFLILVIIGAMFATPVEAQKFSVTPSSIDFKMKSWACRAVLKL